MAPLSTHRQTGSPDNDQTMSSGLDSTLEDSVLYSEDNNMPAKAVPSGLTHFPIVWKHVVELSVLHVAALYGMYLMFTSAMWQTNLFAIFLYQMSGLGVTAGAHRLWAHHSYKAKLPLRVFLAFCFTMAFQWDILVWVRNHRVHHKYVETDADPHNIKRGFFYAHIGWIMRRKHPDVIKYGQSLDYSDILADPVVRFQRQYYLRLVVICCYIIPAVVPMYLWGETLVNSFFVASVWRHAFTLHQTFLVNSIAHSWGSRPYNSKIGPAENLFANFWSLGEGFHNFHHTFPVDYATSEYGIKYNLTATFIDAMAFIGQAYDRKTVPKEFIQARKLKNISDDTKKN